MTIVCDLENGQINMVEERTNGMLYVDGVMDEQVWSIAATVS